MKNFLCLFLAFSMFSFPAEVSAHSYHMSFTRLEQLSKNSAMKILVRVFADDLTTALKARFSRTVKLSESQLVAKYITENIEIKDVSGKNKSLLLSKIEKKDDVVIINFTAKISEGLRGVKLQQKIFFELFDDQINQVLIKSLGNESTLEFKHGDSFKVIN